MSIQRTKYSDFLYSHQPLFIGHANALTDADIIALAVYELKQLLNISTIEIRLANSYWCISSDDDWIAQLVDHDTSHYFSDMVTHTSYPNATFVLGGMLKLHAAKVATFKKGVCDWYKGEAVLLHFREYFAEAKEKQRVLLFKGC